jgi:hypothetical protein
MVETYKKKANLSVPLTVKFSNIKTPAKLKTKYNSKTKEILSNEMIFNPDHFKILAKTSIKDTKIYLKRTVAHEMGHLDHTVKDWENTRNKSGSLGRYHIPSNELEDYADKYSEKLTKIPDSEYNRALKDLQKKYDDEQRKKRKK